MGFALGPEVPGSNLFRAKGFVRWEGYWVDTSPLFAPVSTGRRARIHSTVNPESSVCNGEEITPKAVVGSISHAQ